MKYELTSQHLPLGAYYSLIILPGTDTHNRTRRLPPCRPSTLLCLCTCCMPKSAAKFTVHSTNILAISRQFLQMLADIHICILNCKVFHHSQMYDCSKLEIQHSQHRFQTRNCPTYNIRTHPVCDVWWARDSTVCRASEDHFIARSSYVCLSSGIRERVSGEKFRNTERNSWILSLEE